MTYNPPRPSGPVYINDEEFNQPAPIGYGTRALMFHFAASPPTLAHMLTIDFDGVCTLEWMG